MSIQAVAWAIEQEDVPARAALVLISIANHADHTDGYCWLKAETIAREARCRPRSVFRYIGALIRNGYIRRETKRGEDGKQRANDYWILFDRAPSAWEWGAHVEDDDDLADDVDATTSCDPGDSLSPGESGVPCDSGVIRQMPQESSGPCDSGVIRKSLDEPSKTKPRKSAPGSGAAAPPRRYAPPPVAPLIQGDLHPDARKPIFVRCGTPAWDAWVAYKKRERRVDWTLTTTLRIDGERRTGWHFPTLFPPGGETASGTSEEGSGVDPPAKKTA